MQECARYLETYKSYESKPSHSIQERVDNDYASRLGAALTAVKGVNKTDASTLGSTMRSFAGILKCSAEELSTCPGIGPAKASTFEFMTAQKVCAEWTTKSPSYVPPQLHRLYKAFHQPFRSRFEACSKMDKQLEGQMAQQGKKSGIKKRGISSIQKSTEKDTKRLQTQEGQEHTGVKNTNCSSGEHCICPTEGLVSEVEEF